MGKRKKYIILVFQEVYLSRVKIAHTAFFADQIARA